MPLILPICLPIKVMYFVLPTVSTIICSTFPVTELDNGDGTVDSYMSVDMGIEANGPRYEDLLLFATIMVVVWPVGWVREREHHTIPRPQNPIIPPSHHSSTLPSHHPTAPLPPKVPTVALRAAILPSS